MPRKICFDTERAVRLREAGVSYAEIGRILGVRGDTVSWWFRHGKGGPHANPLPRGRQKGKPQAGECQAEPEARRAATWDDERRLALVECARQAVERTGMSLGACVVELGRMLRERRKPS